MDNDQKKDEQLDTLFPFDRFDRTITWTQQGRSDGLKEKLHSAIENFFKHGNPQAGLVYFEKLPEGGYELRTYRSND